VSQILTIYDTLAAQVLVVAGKTVKVKDLHELPTQPASPDMPVRLLLPVGRRASGDLDEFNSFGAGGVATIVWRVTDLLLWRASGKGARNVLDVAEPLVEYMGVYAQMARTLRYRKWSATGLQMTPGSWEYPLGSGTLYDGVECVVTFNEILS
jgi:hypothetical protein